jgi:hypothetical protein
LGSAMMLGFYKVSPGAVQDLEASFIKGGNWKGRFGVGYIRFGVEALGADIVPRLELPVALLLELNRRHRHAVFETQAGMCAGLRIKAGLGAGRLSRGGTGGRLSDSSRHEAPATTRDVG